MKDFMKQLPLALSLLTLLLVGSMWLDSRDSNCENCTRMRQGISQRMGQMKKNVGSRGDTGHGQWKKEDGKRYPKKG
jgi:hypothetical protein